jgi:hypothetical protein
MKTDLRESCVKWRWMKLSGKRLQELLHEGRDHSDSGMRKLG